MILPQTLSGSFELIDSLVNRPKQDKKKFYLSLGLLVTLVLGN